MSGGNLLLPLLGHTWGCPYGWGLFMVSFVIKYSGNRGN